MNLSIKNIRFLCLVTALLSFTLTAVAADDANAAFSKAPTAVQAAVKKALGNRKMEEFTKEEIGKNTVYEAGFKVDDVDHAFVVSEKGDVLREEVDIDVSKVPVAVTNAVKKAHPDGSIDEAATATAGAKKFYVIDVKVGDDTRVMEITADGFVSADDIEK